MQTLLQNLAEIRVGLTLRGRDSSLPGSDGGLHLLRISDISEQGQVHIKELHPVKEEPAGLSKFLLKANDVVIANRGKRITAALIPEGLEAIASSQLFRLRVNSPDILPAYLHWFINHPRTQAFFLSRTRGSYVKTLSIRYVRELPVSVPPLADQEKIVTIANLATQEQELTERILHLRRLHLDAALSHHLKPHDQ